MPDTEEKKILSKVKCICIAPHRERTKGGGFIDRAVGDEDLRHPSNLWKPIKKKTSVPSAPKEDKQ